MKWYNYVACFFSGVFFTNTLPHLVHGVNGVAFPTPFGNPPGTGLSSPVINVFWALLNLTIGILLLKTGKVSFSNKFTVVLFIAGIGLFSLLLSLMAPAMLINYKH
jgi:hypothetical protein